MASISKERLLDTKAKTSLQALISEVTANGAAKSYYIYIPYECLLTDVEITSDAALAASTFLIDTCTIADYTMPEDLTPVLESVITGAGGSITPDGKTIMEATMTEPIITGVSGQTITKPILIQPNISRHTLPDPNAVASTGILTFSGVAANNETVTIGAGADQKIYTFKDALTAPETANEVLVEVSAELCIDNLVAAINKATGGGTKYGSDTVAHSLVTAVKSGTDKVVITSKIAGTLGNASPYVTTKVLAQASWGAGLMGAGAGATEGVNAVVGSEGDMIIGSDFAKGWICSATNTIADANWKPFSLT